MRLLVLDDIPFRVAFASLRAKLHVDETGEDAEALTRLAAEAEAVARPKALLAIAPIDAKGDDWVRAGDQTFHSRVLRVNLDATHRLFACVATCGTELDEWSRSLDEMLHRWWADTLKEMALRAATRALKVALDEQFKPGRTSAMAPGSLPDWPLTEQAALFALLGDAPASIGVTLSPSMLMSPTKSSSSVRFATERPFESCMLCPMDPCPGRRADYDPELYQKRYQAA